MLKRQGYQQDDGGDSKEKLETKSNREEAMRRANTGIDKGKVAPIERRDGRTRCCLIAYMCKQQKGMVWMRWRGIHGELG